MHDCEWCGDACDCDWDDTYVTVAPSNCSHDCDEDDDGEDYFVGEDGDS